MNLLISYEYIRSSVQAWDATLDYLHDQGLVRVMLDSGAFSAYTKGSVIKPDDYHRYIRPRRHLFWQYVQLDRVMDAKTTRANLDRAVDAGLTPMPVLTADLDPEDTPALRQYHSHICVAGGTAWSPDNYAARMELCSRAVDHEVWLHGLGFTRTAKSWTSRAKSIDSSTWSNGNRYGVICTFSERSGVWQHRAESLFRRPRDRWPRELADVIRLSGASPYRLVLERETVTLRDCISMLAWLRYIDHCEKYGTVVFLACSSVHNLISLGLALRLAQPGGHLNASRFDDERKGVMVMLTRDRRLFWTWFHSSIRAYRRSKS